MKVRLKKKKAAQSFYNEIAAILSRQHNTIAEIQNSRKFDTYLMNMANDKSCETKKQLEAYLSSVKRMFQDVYWWIKLFIAVNAVMLFAISYCLAKVI